MADIKILEEWYHKFPGSHIGMLLLTAGHDADLLEGTISIGVTNGSESFTQINGNLKMLKAGDMMMKDKKGVVCSIIYGQDKRTSISPKTKRALYVTYVPEGISRETVISHLDKIKENILLFASDAEIEYQEVFSA